MKFLDIFNQSILWHAKLPISTLTGVIGSDHDYDAVPLNRLKNQPSLPGLVVLGLPISVQIDHH
jgi:hypothetical protein